MSGKGRSRLAARHGTMGEIRITRVGIDRLRMLAAAGLSDTALASAIQCVPSTFKRLVQRTPELEIAIQEGRSALEGKLSSKLIEMALAGEVAPLIFACKNFGALSDTGPRDRATAPSVNVLVQSISLPPQAATAEEYRAFIEATATTAAPKEPTDE